MTVCVSRDESGVLLESEVATGEVPDLEDAASAIPDGRTGGKRVLVAKVRKTFLWC